jgi:hypothetical protein
MKKNSTKINSLKKKNEMRLLSKNSQTASNDRVGSISGNFFRLPFGPIKFINKMDLIQRILRQSEEFSEKHFFEMLGFLEQENPSWIKSNSKSQEVDPSTQDFSPSKAHLKKMLNMTTEELENTYQFLRNVFGSVLQGKLTVFDVVYKDLLSLDVLNREMFKPFMDQHWTNILGKISMEHDSIEVSCKEVITSITQ